MALILLITNSWGICCIEKEDNGTGFKKTENND